MKLLLVTSDFLPKLGGVSLMMHHLANALEDKGVSVTVAPPPYKGDIVMTQKYRITGGSPESWRCDLWRQRILCKTRLRQRLKVLTEEIQPDVILLGDQAYKGLYIEACLWIKKIYNIPIGVFCHGKDIRDKMIKKPKSWREFISYLFGPYPTNRARIKLVYKLIQEADWFFANSHYTAELLWQHANRNAVVTGCGLSKEDWQRECFLTPKFDAALKRARRDELGVSNGSLVTYVGRLAARKNIGVLLESISYLNDTQLAIVGNGNIKSMLQKQAKDLGVDDRVIWYGSVSENRKWEILRASDALCLPATEMKGDGGVEGFGIVLLEAAAAGTPVVAAASGGMTDVVIDRHTGLLWGGQEALELARAIKNIIEDHFLAACCVDEARNRIKVEFNWEKVAEKVMSEITADPQI